MSAINLDGKKLAQEKRQELAHDCQLLNFKLKFVVILVGNNSASEIYVQHKQAAAQSLGIDCILRRFNSDCSQDDIIETIAKDNHDLSIHGIIVQLPLPYHIDANKVLESISVVKDIDCFHPYNLGRLALGNPILRPCTPYGIMQLLKHYNIDLTGKNCLVIGASRIVGRPMMLEFLNHKATPTICHSKSQGLNDKLQHADIIVSATGQLDLIDPELLQKHQVIIDVGINRLENNSIRGDIDFIKAKEKVAYITPVPGGVGPMTVTALLQNVYNASKLQLSLPQF